MSENTMNRRDALRRLVAVPVGLLTGEAMWDALDRLTPQRRLWAGHSFAQPQIVRWGDPIPEDVTREWYPAPGGLARRDDVSTPTWVFEDVPRIRIYASGR